MNIKWIKVFLRFSVAVGFLSAVADRFGYWPKAVSVWGNWENFLAYTKVLNPLVPENLIPALGICATVAEVVLAVLLIIGYKTALTAKLSGCMLLIFGLSMTFSTGIKGAFDYSVFTAAAACFALASIKERYLEIDSILYKN